MRISTNSGLHSARQGKPRYSLQESIDFYAEVGFKVLDLNFSASIYDHPFKIDKTLVDADWRSNIQELKQAVDKHGIQVRYSHLPFYQFDAPDLENEAFKREMTLRAIEASGMLGVEWAVVHPSRLEDREAARIETERYLGFLLEHSEQYDLGIAFENMSKTGSYGSNADDLSLLVDRFGKKAGICWDTGHANLSKVSQKESIKRMSHRLKVLHIHDNSGHGDEHRPPFMGTVNWEEVMLALKLIGFAGDLNFEVTATHLPESMRRPHGDYVFEAGKHLCALFENASTDEI